MTNQFFPFIAIVSCVHRGPHQMSALESIPNRTVQYSTVHGKDGVMHNQRGGSRNGTWGKTRYVSQGGVGWRSEEKGDVGRNKADESVDRPRVVQYQT